MPTYDYLCEKCGPFEAKQGMNDPELSQCPTCAGTVSRQVSRNVNFIFKGSGFYATDYRGKDYQKAAAADAAAPAGAGVRLDGQALSPGQRSLSRAGGTGKIMKFNLTAP